jgi:hypothetical protein
MKCSILVGASLFVFLACSITALQAAPPVVTNVTAQQRAGTKLVDITYDVTYEGPDSLTIAIDVSGDGGRTFTIPAQTFSGAVGSGITPGLNKNSYRRSFSNKYEICAVL